MTPVPASLCVLPECDRRFKMLEVRVQTVEDRQRDDHTSIAVLRTQVALGAALGSILGGGIVTAFARLFHF